MRSKFLIVGACLGAVAILCFGFVSPRVSDVERAMVGIVFTIVTALGVMVVKKSRAREAASRGEESVKLALAEQAQSSVMRDGLVCGVVIGGAAVILHDLPAAIPVFALVTFMAIDFWIRYKALLRPGKNAA